MDNETNAVDDFLGNLKNTEDQDPFKEPSEDSPLSTQESKENQVIEEEKVEKALPFHKDPKVQRYLDGEISKRISAIEPSVRNNSTQTQDEFKELIDAFTQVAGNDTPEKVQLLNRFKETMSNFEDRVAQRALEESRSEAQASAQAEAAADDQLMTGFEAIEESTGIDLFAAQNKKLKGQFIDFIKQVGPKDEYGELTDFPDIEQTFQAFQATRGTSNQTKTAKELAGRTLERGTSSPAPVQSERVTFDTVEKAFDKLTR